MKLGRWTRDILSCPLFRHVCPEQKGAAYPTILGETADRKERRDDAVFSICFNGRDDDTRKTVTDYGCVIVYIFRTVRYAKYRQTKYESCLFDPRFT
jgi:hypothetical protein